MCDKLNQAFRPFIVSSHGLFHPDATQVISDIITFGFSQNFYNTNSGDNQNLLENNFKDDIVCAILKGNALICNAGRQKHRRAFQML